jgi:hypothetical protein
VTCVPVLYSRDDCSLTQHDGDITRSYRMALSAGNDQEWRGALESGMSIYFKSPFFYYFTQLIGLYVHLLQT